MEETQVSTDKPKMKITSFTITLEHAEWLEANFGHTRQKSELVRSLLDQHIKAKAGAHEQQTN